MGELQLHAVKFQQSFGKIENPFFAKEIETSLVLKIKV